MSPSRVIPTLMIVPVAAGMGLGVGDGDGATVGDGLGEGLGDGLEAGLAGPFVAAVEVLPHAAAKRAAATRAPRKTGLGIMK
jgi:hypothetical protein